MSDTAIQVTSTVLAADGFRYDPTCLVVVGKPDYDEWRTALHDVARVQHSSPWWLGDLLVYGEFRWGEGVYQEREEGCGIDAQTAANCKLVCSRFPAPGRDPHLTFSHYAELAALAARQPEQAAQIASEAVRENLSTREVRERVAGTKPPEERYEKALVKVYNGVLECLECSQGMPNLDSKEIAALQAAANAVGHWHALAFTGGDEAADDKAKQAQDPTEPIKTKLGGVDVEVTFTPWYRPAA